MARQSFKGIHKMLENKKQNKDSGKMYLFREKVLGGGGETYTWHYNQPLPPKKKTDYRT